MKSLGHASSPQTNEEEQSVYFPDNETTTQATNESENTNAEPTAPRRYPLRESRRPPSRYGQETETDIN